jgi:poly(3-hydroxyalkanoate) synthetase
LQSCAKSIKGRVFNIASEGDVVAPISSALLGDNVINHLILKNLGHLGMLFSPLVAEKICHLLENPSDTP